MVSCIQIETASLVFAYFSLLITALGALAFTAMLVHVNVLMVNLITGVEGKLSADYVTAITIYDFAINIGLAVLISILVVTFAFTIMLTKGLLSKKAHLVKTYYIYGVTMNTLLVILNIFYILTNVVYIVPFGYPTLFGLFLYSLILIMIRKTYLKFSNTDTDQFSHKKLEEEKSTA